MACTCQSTGRYATMKRDERQYCMSFGRLSAVSGTAIFLLVLSASVQAQETLGTAPTFASSSQPVTAINTESSQSALSPAPDSNLHSTNDLRDQVSSEPRRFQYGLEITFRGVYDDNINISQTNPISDFYFTIEPLLTLGFGDIKGREENFLRLDYAPSVFLFADHSNDD